MWHGLLDFPQLCAFLDLRTKMSEEGSRSEGIFIERKRSGRLLYERSDGFVLPEMLMGCAWFQHCLER